MPSWSWTCARVRGSVVGGGRRLYAHTHTAYLELGHRRVLAGRGRVLDELAVELGEDLLGHLLAKPLFGVLDRDVEQHVVELTHFGQELRDLGARVRAAVAHVQGVALHLAGAGLGVGAHAKGQREGRGLQRDALALPVGVGDADEDDLAALLVLLERAEGDGLGVERVGEDDVCHGVCVNRLRRLKEFV
jgi:hypothetical protein